MPAIAASVGRRSTTRPDNVSRLVKCESWLSSKTVAEADIAASARAVAVRPPSGVACLDSQLVESAPILFVTGVIPPLPRSDVWKESGVGCFEGNAD